MTDANLLHEAIEKSKSFIKFSDVLMAVSLHPEWFTTIPDNRQWAIIHQVIFSGDINHLNQLLALQKSNKNFRLLTNTRDNKTILDVASERNDIPEMRKHLEKLLKLDEMLNHARNAEWDACYQIVENNPSYVNEKPPYRLYYLIHHMACVNAQAAFEMFKTIGNCKFDLNLQAKGLKVNKIAELHNQPGFARFIEKEYPALLDEDNEPQRSSEQARQRRAVLTTVMVKKCIVRDLEDDLMGKPEKIMKTRREVMAHLNEVRNEREIALKDKKKDAIDVEEAAQKEMLLDNLICPITLNIFTDPVVAADGFTYERSAIENWLKKNDRSPMTNQTFLNKLLSPNEVVKSIICALETKA